MATFGKRETIGGHAQAMLDGLRQRFEQGEDKEQLITEINRLLGDSVEKVLLIKTTSTLTRIMARRDRPDAVRLHLCSPRDGEDAGIDLNTPDVDRLTPDDIQLTFGPAAVHEEIETWKEVYGIDERYKAKCCDSDARDWLEQLRILCDAHGITPDTTLATVQQQTAKAPVANNNFLKQAFLEGCQRAGMFDI
jgi:hypothetical protein